MIQLYLMDTDKASLSVYQTLFDMLSSDEKVKITSFRLESDKRQRICAELLIRYLICQKIDVKNKDLEIKKTAYGKPYLPDHPQLCFNLSHTKNALAVAIASAPVGVDIEKERSIDLQIAKRYFTKQEYDWIIADPRQNLHRFYEVWTKKEAYIKCIGKGLAIDLKSFNVLNDSLEETFKTLYLPPYILSVCSLDSMEQIPPIIMTPAELLHLTKLFI